MTPTSDRPLVTFAVIAYRQEAVVREAIAGAFTQTYEPLEILLSDDCSPDRTFTIMEEMAAAYDGPHKVILNRNSQNIGVVPHIDRVMELVSGEFVVVNAGDDISVPERTEKQVAVWLKSNRQVKLVHSAARQIDAESHLLGIKRPPNWVDGALSPARFIRDNGFVIGATAAWDRSLFDAFGPLGQELSAEDTILPFRALLSGELRLLDEVLLLWRVGGVSDNMVQSTGWNYLYSRSHKARKWHAENARHILTHFSDVPYHGKSETEAVCRIRAERLQFPVDLAESTHLQRLAMGPRAVRLALRHRSLGPVKDWLRYLFDILYMPYATWRISRHLPKPPQEMEPELPGKGRRS